MKSYNIAVIAGDGIGPEVTSSAVDVLKATASKCGFELNFDERLFGGASIDAYGEPLTEETLAACKASDAVLLGAVGGPKWDKVDPSIRPEKGLLNIRKGMGLYSNLRPALMFEELAAASPIKNIGAIDILIVRELTGGIYFGERGRKESDEVLPDGTPKGVIAYDVESYSVGEITRIVRQGFTYAQGRNKKLTVVDKANVLESSRMWREITESLKPEYPDVEVDYLYVDNASMQLIARPSSFDVIVTSNIFGDILSDEAGQITGSIGMLPSASLGTPGTPGLYEPVHGSAPDIAGTGKANPLATILSAAMLLRWSLNEVEAADMIENAVRKVLADGYRTVDILGNSSDSSLKVVDTTRMTEAVIARL